MKIFIFFMLFLGVTLTVHLSLSCQLYFLFASSEYSCTYTFRRSSGTGGGSELKFSKSFILKYVHGHCFQYVKESLYLYGISARQYLILSDLFRKFAILYIQNKCAQNCLLGQSKMHIKKEKDILLKRHQGHKGP
jgi:hypothetical protein